MRRLSDPDPLRQLAFVILGASMAAIGLMILVSSFLATGATRTEVRQCDIMTQWILRYIMAQ